MSKHSVCLQTRRWYFSVQLLALFGLCACSSDPSGVSVAPSTSETGGATGSAGAGGSAGGAPSAGAAGDAAGGGSAGNGAAAAIADTLYVDGRFLRDRCGNKLVLRGVNEMIVWSPGKDGMPEFAEIAKTGANAVRIVWTSEGSAAELDTAIKNAVEQELVPMVEHHGATGELEKVPEVVDYWTAPDVVSVLQKHAAYLLLNIANEAGAAVTQQAFDSTYQLAITRLRDVGISVPIVIDAPGWGQDIDMLQAAGPGLVSHDPEHNLLFSVHMWWADPNGTRVKAELQESVNLDLPLIVGEFAQHAVSGCAANPFNYEVLLDEAQKHEIGWLAWSWGGVSNGDCAAEGSFDMTTNGMFGSWEESWASEVAVNHANSIQKTSLRPASLISGTCAP